MAGDLASNFPARGGRKVAPWHAGAQVSSSILTICGEVPLGEQPGGLGETHVEIDGTHIEDTFAEAFRMRYVRLVVTAHDEFWLDAAVREFTGYSSSIISCDSETGLERRLAAGETPDGRLGAAILVFG